MPTQRTWITGVTAAGLVATSLVAAPAFAEDAPADAPAVEAVLSDAPVEESIPEPTTSDVALLPVEAPAGYTASAEVPEPTGDAQQEELREVDSSDATTGAARVEPGSEVVVFGVTWAVGDVAADRVEYRTLSAGEWTPWAELEVEAVPDSIDSAEILKQGTEPVFVTDVEAIEVAVFAGSGGSVEDLSLTVIDPEGSAPLHNSLGSDATGGAGDHTPSPLTDDSSKEEVPEVPRSEEAPARPESADQTVEVPDGPTAVSPLAEATTVFNTAVYRQGSADVVPAASGTELKISSRKAWKADERIRDKTPDNSIRYKGVIVHHTAGENNYERSQVPKIIRGIYGYHVGLGWGDIGYHLLVDKFGGVWEGRYGALKRQFQGAHAIGANFDTFGISVLGNYDEAGLPKAAQNSTAKAIAWMFDRFDIQNPKGKMRVDHGRVVNVIAGHRDVFATACPGRYFYPKLPAIRDQVQSYLTPPLSGMVKRRWDSDRFGTAAKIALASHPNGADTVYIAAGMDFPDALSGGAAAGIDGAPVLLTLTKSLPAQTASALQKLAPKNIVILGGTGSVNGTVASRLKSYGKVVRYGGADRYETAAKVARAKAPDADVVYIASGSDFPDALSGVPIAGADRAPLLLTEKNRLPAVTRAEIQRMRPKRIIILGGTGVVGSNVANALKSYGTVARRAGSDRFDTAVKTAQAKYTGTVNTVYVANGMDFPDALAGGPAAKKENGPLLLVTRDGVPAQTAAALAKMQPKKIVLLGGTGAVSAANERRLDAFITE